ncbi:hypothetical protein DEV91_12526 [Phyllobacterium brassicacearum]|nr:hypothetical protein DEV91_12526 [Phyllobacterium brassicacearum]
MKDFILNSNKYFHTLTLPHGKPAPLGYEKGE